ncbi:MAG: dihydrolipoyl dehydrogenase [candidate division NC10 bacterium]|nr:dihydrolipoyl dehydrogenase [candidate division NC10 bacterium]
MSAYEVVVLGAGPGGYVAALRAAQLGATVCLIEKDVVGGTCLNRGCIPSKALIHSAALWKRANEAGAFGVTASNWAFDWSKAQSRKSEIVNTQVKGVHTLLGTAKIEVKRGVGSLVDARTVRITANGAGETVTGKAIIIACGSEPAGTPGVQVDGERVLTSTEALELSALPRTFLIVGGGVIGMEFASMLSSLGTQVTVLEMLPQILAMEDPMLVRVLQGAMQKQGVAFHVNTKVEKVETTPAGVRVQVSGGTILEAQRVLIATGRALNSKGIGLEAAGVNTERGAIQVNERMETSVPGIYAVGDITGISLLAHVASMQGLVAAGNATGGRAAMDYSAIPNCIYTDPEIASVGLSEPKAKEQGRAVKVGRFNFAALGKAMCIGETAGMVKVVADAQTDKVLGVGIVGPHATDIIAEGVLAVRHGLTAAQVAEAIHAHPTLSEAMGEAMHDVHGQAIHKARLRA